jgi:hypothetical protein
MNPRRFGGLLAAPLLWACGQYHQAEVRSAAFPPPLEQPVLHSSRLWIELSPATRDAQCIEPKLERKLCFERVEEAFGSSLAQSLWTSFPGVFAHGRGEDVLPGDYVLHVDVKVEGLAPDPSGPGWSARASGQWKLTRDGAVLAGQEVSARSRPDFGYGRPLGVGAGEALDAIAAHIAAVLGQLPESRPLRPVPLPEVVARPRPSHPAPPKLRKRRSELELSRPTRPAAARSLRGAR